MVRPNNHQNSISKNGIILVGSSFILICLPSECPKANFAPSDFIKIYILTVVPGTVEFLPAQFFTKRAMPL